MPRPSLGVSQGDKPAEPPRAPARWPTWSLLAAGTAHLRRSAAGRKSPGPPSCEEFLYSFEIPCQIVKGAHRARWRVLAWGPWLGAFFRLLDAL